MIKLGGIGALRKKSRSNLNLGDISPRCTTLKNVAFGYVVVKIIAGCLALHFAMLDLETAE